MSSTPSLLCTVAWLSSFGSPRAERAPAEQGGADAGPTRATLIDRQGRTVGTADLEETPHGVLVTLEVRDLPPGPHALHFHAVGACEPPFDSAGAHFSPEKKEHGLANPKGAHAGDLPNVFVQQDGTAKVQVLAPGVRLRGGKKALLDDDGAALMIHERADDHRTDPAGNAGDRIACGAIRP